MFEQNENFGKKMKWVKLYKVGSESKLNSWPDISVGQSFWTEFNGHKFKFPSSQLSIATSKSPTLVNTK